MSFLNSRNGVLYEIYDTIRPKLVSSGGKSCLIELRQKNVQFVKLGDIEEKSCLIKNAVRINKLPQTRLSSAVTLNCKTALDFANWAEEINAKNIVHMGSYIAAKCVL